jgi:hypothetical protein
MNELQKTAYGTMFDAGETISKLIVRAKASMQPLELPDEIVAKLIEAQQALFAAQRLMMEL